MSATFGGPGSAFAFGSFTTTTASARAPRRTTSSGKEERTSPIGVPAAQNGGPQPAEGQSNPSLGSWANPHEHAREGDANSHPDGQQRSFSSILSPAHPADAHEDSLDPAKPFVYSREFLLSLYDDDKRNRRPLELARHDIATTDSGAQPWALTEYRDGEKELFATSIHPPTNRPNRTTSHRNDSFASQPNSNSNGGNLDLGSLAQLPRERDRNLSANGMNSSGSPRVNGGLTAGIGNSAEKEFGRKSRGSIGLGGTGVLGGVMGNPGKTPSPAKPALGSNEVWQGGRWRRGGTAELMDPVDNRSSRRQDSNQEEIDEVPTTWDEEEEANDSQHHSLPTPPSSEGQASHSQRDHYSGNSHFDAREQTVLGSLSLAPDAEDTLPTPVARSIPPGLAPIPKPETALWQYRDPAGTVQGPFAAAMMQDWYSQGHFPGDLMVKRAQEASYETLESLVRRSGDGATPFLTAPFQPVAPPALSQQNSWQTSQPTLDQFGQQQRPFGSHYDSFSTSTPFEAPRLTAQQSYGFSATPERQAPTAVDPWGVPLPSTNASWNDGSSNLFGQDPNRYNANPYQQQQQQQYIPQPPQPPINHFHQADPSLDAFGRPTAARQSPMPSSPYFDPSQLSATATPDWTRLNNASAQHSPIPQPQQTQQQTLQITPIGQNSWSSLVSPSLQNIVDDRTLLPTVLSPALPQPIGPPLSQQNLPKIDVVEAPVPVVSPWASIGKALDDFPIAQEVPKIATLPPPPPPVVAEAPVVAKSTPVARAQKVEPAATLVLPTPIVVASTPAKSPTAAPWIKDDSRPASPVGPSLRQIQELESRQAELRKAGERQVAANNKAIAAVQAAQRAAAAEAESLPSSSTWAAGSAASGSVAPAATPAPWGGKVSVGKTMKEIQEEERKAKLAAAALLVQAGPIPAGGVRGYAGSIGQVKPIPGAPWTTVGVKPVATVIAPVARPLIPGGIPVPVSRLTPSASPLPAKPVVAPVRSIIASVSTPASRTVARSATYDADSPPPPSAEFMKWCRDALKRLNVPNLDEFIQMLLSFPLEASADVLEIISDSVYANSSTLDGRRFASEYSSRRKLDVVARYPSIVLSKSSLAGAGKVKGSSMADMLKSQPVVKTPEWNVKVAGGKKKKGGK